MTRNGLPREIAYRNLELCFPEMTAQERHGGQNFESVGMGVVTGMARFWPVGSEPLDGSERSGAYP